MGAVSFLRARIPHVGRREYRVLDAPVRNKNVNTSQKTTPASIVAACLIFVAAVHATPVQAHNASMKMYDSPYYKVYTDLDRDQAREAVLRMTRMAEEYNARTQAFFSGTIKQKLPFYLFSKAQDYYAAGGPTGSAGVFMVAGGEGKLMAIADTSRDGTAGGFTWHTIQHEGFHQFVHYVVRGDIPIWVNEGLAEYFGEGVFTGDAMITGVVPQERGARIKQAIANGTFKSIEDMMLMSPSQWSDDLSTANYDQAWSMCHFLAHGENGKYQRAFAAFLQGIGRGQTWEKSWQATFGSVAGFEAKWKQYWMNLADDPTAALYAKATVATLTNFLSRAASRKQTFENFDAFIKTDSSALKQNETDWLPPTLYRDAVTSVERLKDRGYVFALVPGKNKQPTLLCTMPDGQKLTGAFRLTGVRLASAGAVTVEVSKPMPVKPAAAKRK